VVCGHSALSRIRSKPELRGRRLAIAGVITGYIAVVLALVSWILLFRADYFVGSIIRLSAYATLTLGFFVFAIWMAFTRRTWGWIVTAIGFCLAFWIERTAQAAGGAREAGALVLICILVGFTVTAVVRAFRRRTRQWIMLALLPFLVIALGLCEAGILMLIYALAHPKPAHSSLTSLTMFAKAPKADPSKDPDVIKGAQALLDKDGSTAVAAFTKAAQRVPENDTILFSLGRGYGMIGDNAMARKTYERATEINPRNADAWMYLGMSLSDTEPAKAIEACKRATELRPDRASGWHILGLIYVAQKQGSLAVAPLERAVQVQPDYAEAWSSLADAYSLTGDYQRSSDARKRAEDLKAQNTGETLKHNAQPMPSQNP
jgi:Flp pilus assembly protein TadD